MKEMDEELYNKYPELLRQYKGSPKETCLCWGIVPGPGWKDLVAAMLSELDAFRKTKAEGLELTQSKEKFGALRVYFNGAKDEKTLIEIEDIIGKYVALSVKTCIRCGAAGTMRNKGWVRCHCDKCEAAYLKGDRQ